MNGGHESHVENPSYPIEILDITKRMIKEDIERNLNIKHVVKNGVVLVADFGCSNGQNSIPAMQTICEAIKKRYESVQLHVIFNDLPSNDFNTLFTSLPPHRSYLASGMPGDFHGRLLPESSLHFAYSAYSLHMLTAVPKAVMDRDSPAWNRGAIIYSRNRKEICDAYLDQFRKDVEWFLESRAVEMVGGGLMALLFPGVPESWNPETEFTIPSQINLLGSCLMDLVKKGRLSEEKVDSFNVPKYFTTPRQLKEILERSNSFSLERMEILGNHGKYTKVNAATDRAVLGRMFSRHFGDEITDELLHLISKKLAASPVFMDPKNDMTIPILAILKRKTK